MHKVSLLKLIQGGNSNRKQGRVPFLHDLSDIYGYKFQNILEGHKRYHVWRNFNVHSREITETGNKGEQPFLQVVQPLDKIYMPT